MVKLFNDDCMNVFKNIPNNSIDLIVTDPPYRITPRGNSGSSGGMLKKKINKQGKAFDYNDINCAKYAPEMFRILKDGSHAYVMTNHKNLKEMLNVFTNSGFHFIKCLIWDKGNKIMGQYYMSQYEYILFFRKGRGNKINHCGTSDIISIPNKKSKTNDGQNLHDTEKPADLMKVLVKNSSKENNWVLDCFMGIGSTGVACINTNRNFIGIEIDKNYFDIAKNRLEQKEV